MPLEMTFVEEETPITLLLPLLGHIGCSRLKALLNSLWDTVQVATFYSFHGFSSAPLDFPRLQLIDSKQKEVLDPCWGSSVL